MKKCKQGLPLGHLKNQLEVRHLNIPSNSQQITHERKKKKKVFLSKENGII